MGDKINWKKIALTFLLCCGKCHIHSKCSKCCEIDIDPELSRKESKNEIKTGNIEELSI